MCGRVRHGAPQASKAAVERVVRAQLAKVQGELVALFDAVRPARLDLFSELRRFAKQQACTVRRSTVRFGTGRHRA